MLIYNFADWTEWLEPQKVTFLPEQKLIAIHPGETQIDVQIDLYSAWKEWIRYYDNAKWAAAFTTFGGDPTSENQYAPRYFFLTNGWKVYAENMSVVVQMNLYSDDGLSPFVITNAAVTNRASDVPVIKSEIEQRLEYGDRVYLDVNSIYAGTSYPVGTIAQPVNNIPDAILIANLYNIKTFYCLSNITIDTIGNTWENYTIYADRENLTISIIDGNYLNNIEWIGFNIDGYFGGGTNKFVDCTISGAYDVSGQMKSCQIQGTIRIWNNLVMSACYSGVAGQATPTYDMNATRTTSFSQRSYSGGVTLLNCNQSGDTTTIELIAGQVKLQPSCTNGLIDIRGVGYLTNLSSGSTVKTSGFIDNIEAYLDESRIVDEQLAYGGKIYVDQISGSTGTTYPTGTIIEPVKDPTYLSNKLNIKDFLIVSDYTYQPSVYTKDVILTAAHPNINLSIVNGQNVDKSKFVGFYIQNAQFSGATTFNTLQSCIVLNASDIQGHMYDCEIWGDVSVNTHLDMWRCWADHYANITINTTNSEIGAVAWYGDLVLRNTNVDDEVILNVGSGKITLDSGCTNGTIDLRGVGYLVNNSSGATVITTGFVDSFGTYIEETRSTDEILAYQGKLYIDTISGFTGSTYPIGTIANPVNNLYDLVSLSNKYRIKDLYLVTSFISRDLSGNTTGLPINFIGYNNFAVNLGLEVVVNSDQPGIIDNSKLNGFYAHDSNYNGRYVTMDNCSIKNFYNLYGNINNSSLAGNITILENTTFANCYPTSNQDTPTISMVNSGGTNCSFRNWNGDLIIDSMLNSNDTIIVEMNAGSLIINSGCVSGFIDVRGVGIVQDNSQTGCTVRRDGQLQASPTEYMGEIVIDTVNGRNGNLFPIGTNSQPVDNITDAITLLNKYQLNKIRIIGSLTIDNGEDLSGIAFTAERSVGNYLFITSAITNSTYFENLTTNIIQSGTCRYTTCVMLNSDNYDGGAKNSLLIGEVDIVGNGSNYLTDCDTYTTNTTNLLNIKVNNKKLNMIRCRGFYKISDKTGSDTTTIDMVGGIIEVTSGCTSGVIYIGGICEVIDNSNGTLVINQAISKQTIEDSTWDATITSHLDPGSTGNALYNVSAGATPEVIAQAVWVASLSGFTGDTAGNYLYSASDSVSGVTDLVNIMSVQITGLEDQVKRILGLVQENFRITNHTYTGDNLDSATVKIYNNSADCDLDVNPLATYSMIALYDGSGKLIDYKVTKT